MKKGLLLFAIVFLLNSVFAQNKTWIGANGANWNVPGNWSPLGVPVPTDTVILNSNFRCNVDINPTIAALKATGIAVNNGFQNNTGIAKTITITSSPVSSPVLYVEAGSTLTLATGVSSGVSITTYGPGSTINTARIDGFLNLGNASSWTLSNGTATTNVEVAGSVQAIVSHTGAFIVGSSITSLRFLSGSSLEWGRNGGNIPAADYQDGSLINVTSVTTTMPAFSGAANYNGLLNWNCFGQTIAGASAILLPSPSYSMDSIRIESTGSGSLRFATEPLGYTIGHLDVRGGIVQLGAPVAGNRTATITTDLKISVTGTVIGNATFTAEPGTAGTPLSVSVGRHFAISGGTLNLTNRPSGGGGNGAFQLYVAGDVTQTAGTVTATTAFGSQNQIALNGTAAQNLTMSTFSGPMALVMFNTSTAGITLLSNLTIPALPSALVFVDGILHTSNTNLLTMDAGSAVFGANNASFVEGPVRKIGNTTFTFPVGSPVCGPSGLVNGYVPLTISNFTNIPQVTDEFTAEYKRAPALSIGAVNNTGLDHVSACEYWTLVRGVTTTSLVDITLAWNEPINNCSSVRSYINAVADLIVANNDNSGSGTWNVFGNTAAFTGTNASGTVTWSTPQSTSFGAFTIGSINFNNPLPVELNYLHGFKQSGNHLLNWKVTCNNNAQATMTVERSADKQNFTSLASITASALRCLQPFDYTDRTPLAGMNYYRLKMVDANGKVTYSAVIALLNKSAGFEIVNLVPSVVTNNAVLNISSAQKTKMDIVITDIAGKQVQKIAYNLIAGSNQFNLNLATLAAGTYQLTGYTENDISKTTRFVKQ